MAAIVVAPNFKWFVRNTSVRCCSSSQTSTRRKKYSLPLAAMLGKKITSSLRTWPLSGTSRRSTHIVDGVVFHPCHKEDFLVGQFCEPIVIVVAAVYHQHCPGRELHSPRDADIAFLAICNHCVTGQMAIVVQEQMQFHCSFCPSEFCPIENRHAQVDGARIQADELVLEPKLLLRSRCCHHRLAFCQCLFKNRPV